MRVVRKGYVYTTRLSSSEVQTQEDVSLGWKVFQLEDSAF